MIGIRTKDRPLATYVCGNPGSGKSTLLQRMILHDIQRNEGVCVIDPTAQLIKVLLGYIPQKHLDRVVYFNTSMPVPLNFFSGLDDDEKQELVTDISNIIDLSTAPIAKNYLRRIINALFEANANPKVYDPKKGIDRRYTLFDIPRVVLDDDFRQQLLDCCHPERQYDFPPYIKLQADSITAIIIRMSQITDSPMMKTILGARAANLNVADLIDQNKIFLVDLKETEGDAIVGSIIAAKIQHAIFARRHLDDLYACRPYYLYIDECDVILKFAEARFAAIIGRARKYKLCMTIANPIPSDLPEAIQKGIGKIGNLIIFNLDPSDGRIFKSKIAPYDVEYLTNLHNFHALLRTNNKTQAVKVPEFLKPRATKNAEYVRDITLRDYGSNARKSLFPSHNSGDGKTDTTLPDDRAHARSIDVSGRVLRPQDQGPRTPYQGKNPKPKRYPDRKPDPETPL